jgi:hypothetical protein
VPERRCSNCGRGYYPKAGSQRFCSVGCRLEFQAKERAVTGRSRYGALHQRIRKQLAAAVATGAVRCARCREPIEPGQSWDLGHVDGNGTLYGGPEHSRCNRATSAHRANGYLPNGESMSWPDGPADKVLRDPRGGYWGPANDEGVRMRWSQPWFGEVYEADEGEAGEC